MKIIPQLIGRENSAIFVITCSVKEIQVKILPIREKVGQGGDTEGSVVGGGGGTLGYIEAHSHL